MTKLFRPVGYGTGYGIGYGTITGHGDGTGDGCHTGYGSYGLDIYGYGLSTCSPHRNRRVE